MQTRCKHCLGHFDKDRDPIWLRIGNVEVRLCSLSCIKHYTDFLFETWQAGGPPIWSEFQRESAVESSRRPIQD